MGIFYTSNINTVIDKYINNVLSKSAQSELTGEIADMVLDNNKERVFEQGIDVNGSRIPGYSPTYAKKRLRNSKRIDLVNMTFTGEFQEDYNKYSLTNGGYRIGFSLERSLDILEGNQEKKGIRLFGVSDDDKDEANDIIQKFLDRS